MEMGMAADGASENSDGSCNTLNSPALGADEIIHPGEDMKRTVTLLIPALTLAPLVLALPLLTRAQADAEKAYKTNCVLCHGPDGSGTTPSGKALKAQDLRSEAVQKKSDADLTASITAGKGKMPAFGKKLKPEDIQQLVAFIRALPKK
jgi:cytochrome c6